MVHPKETLLDILKRPLPKEEMVYAYSARARQFNVEKDVRVTQIGLAIMIVALLIWLLFAMFVPQQGPMMWIALITNILFMPMAIYSAKNYPKELRQISEHLDDEIVLKDEKIWVRSGGISNEVEIKSLKRGAFLTFDAGTGLNFWRLKLIGEGVEMFFDPSKMHLATLGTPYPR